MMDKNNVNWNHGFVQEDLENIKGVSIVLQIAEKKLQQLKTLIKDTERKVYEGKISTVVKRRHKSSQQIVIPRVNKKFLLLRNIPGGGYILQFKEKCPKWLVVLAEGYSAIDESFYEIREDMRQLCVKFIKQKDVYSKIHDERSKHLILFTEDIKKIELETEKEKSTVGEYIRTVSAEVEERKKILNENKEKRDKLRSINESIKEEIEKLADKFWAIDATIRYESEFVKGSKSKIEECNEKKMDEEEFLDKLRGELESALRESEQVRYAVNIDRFRLNENMRNLENSLNEELEKQKDMEEYIERKIEAKEYFTELIIVKTEEKAKIKEVLNEKQSALEEEINELKKQRAEVEEVLNKKKRHQEEYQSVNELLCVKVSTYRLQITLQDKKVEKLKSSIHSEKKQFIVPLKQEINKYNVVVKEFDGKRRIVQLQLDSLYERLYDLEIVQSFQRHSEMKIKYFSNQEPVDYQEIMPQDIMIQLEDVYELWEEHTEEYNMATYQLNDYRDRVSSLKEQICSLRAEADTYWRQLQSMKREVQKAAYRYISKAKLGGRRDNHPRNPTKRNAITPDPHLLPLHRTNTLHLQIADRPVINKPPTKPTDVHFNVLKQMNPPAGLTNEQIYANFGKFLFL